VLILIGAGLLVALAIWLSRPARAVPPGDAVEPVDAEALADAERELQDSPDGETLDQAEEDDWGPGAGR
jgi:hypothetical protein